MSQPTFKWTEKDRLLLVSGCTVVVYRDGQSRKPAVELIKVAKVHRDHLFHEVTRESLSFMGAPTRYFVTEELAHCDPSSLPGYVASEPEPEALEDEGTQVH